MDGCVAAEHALRTAAPHELLDVLRAVLVERYGAQDVELFMADYGLTVLQPVSVLPHTLEPVSVHNSPAGRAFDLGTGRADVVDAGSPQLWRQRDDVVEHVGFEAQLPLGMFEETDYVTQDFRAEPGDRLVFVSDGVHAVASPEGEAYGEAALAPAIQSTRLLPAAEVPRAILRELAGHRGEATPDDDAVTVCLDWHGRPAGR
ncbi:PP2C family protein-serine/threonine phosphatase [Streptomyces sp. NPDC058299]|uniref:PP2C family protein-serine/threonine phosphatase n=1 Tax=Streptomyces sp. NPDC058299 TaxID=3346435 RepID=UPI0036EC7ED8